MSAPDATRTLRWARWGIVTAALVMGGVLVASAWLNYISVRRSSESLARGQADLLIESFALALHQQEGPPGQEVLEAVLRDYWEDGLRFIAVRGSHSAQAGESAADPADNRGPIGGPPMRMSWVGDRVRIVAHGPATPPPRHTPGWAGHFRRAPRGNLTVELIPSLANQVRARARAALLASSVAAGLIWLSSLIAFRWLRRRERLEGARAHERHLAALGEMSAVLAHEIRNPLASLKGHAQLLAESLPEAGPQRDKANRVVGEAVRLEDLTGGLLEFVRTGAIQRERTDPTALLRAAAAEVGAGRIDIDDQTAPSQWSLDRPRIQQVLANLLRNAVQASPDEGRVSARVFEEAGQLGFEVRDAGPGIPAGQECVIFEAFRTGRARGTGLGLAVAKRVVELHGGAIRAMNHADGGALFRIDIPA